MKSIPANYPAITENTENVLVKRTPQRLIIGKPISQYASYSAMFCPLIQQYKHKKHLCIHPAITENTENILVKRAPHISVRESHNASISSMSNSFHNIVSKA